MANMNDESMTKDERQEKIINFIKSHPYCNVQTVVRGLENDISRVTVFKLLRELTESGAVKRHLDNNQKRNARDHKLVVDEDNLLVSVRLELDEFESAYFNFFNKQMIGFEPHIQAAQKVKDGYERIEIEMHLPDGDSVWLNWPLPLLHAMLAARLLNIFYSMVDACLFQFLFIWSQKITDQQVLQQLYSMVFSKIADMQARIWEGFKSSPMRNLDDWLKTLFIQERFRGSEGPGPLENHLDSFKILGKEKEIEPVIDSLWKIIGDLQPHIYPEPRTQGWPFKYGEDDWRKLVNLLRQHPESSPLGKGRIYRKKGRVMNRGVK
jgi:hypothetical protein